MRNASGVNYVGRAIIRYLRDERHPLPSEQDASLLDRLPIIDALREAVEIADIPWLLSQVETQPDALAGLACSLLRRYINYPEVLSVLERRWDTANPYLKSRLMWRMLDGAGLSTLWRREFLDFILRERQTFVQFNREFFGSEATGVIRLLSRIGDPKFPMAKKWIYLCCLSELVNESNAANALLLLGRSIADPFAREAVEALLLAAADSTDALPDHATANNDEVSTSEGIPSTTFVAVAVVDALRSGYRPSESAADSLNVVPLIDALRQQIREFDLPWLSAVISAEDGAVSALHLSLTRNHCARRTDIQELLKAKWESTSPFYKTHLIWRLLDDPQLPAEWHEKVLRFVLNEGWQTFKEVSRTFLGHPNAAVTEMVKRIGDPAFPDSKNWLYLCRAAAVDDDQTAAKALVMMGLHLPGEFTRRAAGALLEKVWGENPP